MKIRYTQEQTIKGISVTRVSDYVQDEKVYEFDNREDAQDFIEYFIKIKNQLMDQLGINVVIANNTMTWSAMGINFVETFEIED